MTADSPGTNGKPDINTDSKLSDAERSFLADAAERRISRQVRSTWDALQRTLETVQAYKKAAAANKKSLEIKEANFEEGLQSMLDVLNVQRDYFIVSNRYQNARYDYATLVYRFKQLVGDLQISP